MSSLFRQNTKFRPAVMKLCTMLGERYAKHLERTQNRFLNKNDCRGLLRCSASEGLHGKFSNAVECDEEAGCEEACWDDFKEKSIRKALEDVFHYKQVSKLDISKRVGSGSEEWCDLNTNVERHVHL
jgi:general transcription factor 3C polypeptide 1